MAARTKKPNKHQAPTETRAAEAATIAWALSMLAACAAEIVAGLAYALVLVWVAVDEKHDAVTREMLILPTVLLMIALVTGIVCLVLTVLATRIRKTPPPRAVTRFAIVVGAAPIVFLVIFSLVR